MVVYTDDVSDWSPRSSRRRSSTSVLNPRYIADVMVRRRGRIFIIGLLLMAMLSGAILLLTPRYSGTAIVLVDPRQQRVLQADAVLSGIGNDMAAVDSQVEVIQSIPIAMKVISDLKLDQDPEFAPSNNALTEFWRSMTGEDPQSGIRGTLSRFAKNLRVRRRGLTYILEIEFLSRSRERSAEVANAIAKAYVDQQGAAKIDATSDASNFLGERLIQLRKQSAEADAAVARFREQNGLVNSGERRSIVEQQIAETNQQLVAASRRTEEIQSRLKQIEKAGLSAAAKSSLVEALSSPVITALRAQYATAARTGAELSQSLGPLHPAIKNSNAELASLNAQIDAEIARLVVGVRNEFEAAQARERSLQSNLAKLKTDSASNDHATVRLHELEREAEAAQTILQRSLVRYKETKEQQGLQTADVRLLSPASVPLTSTGPNQKVLFALALMLSFGLAIAFAIVTDPRPEDSDDAIALSAPLLAIARYTRAESGRHPDLGLEAIPHATSLSPALAPAELHLPALGMLPDVSQNRLPATGDSASSEAGLTPLLEAMRRLARDFTNACPQRPCILAIASASPGAGVSTIAATLADALSDNGEKTLLIDASIGSRSSERSKFSPAELFKSNLPLELAIEESASGADVLHCGSITPNDLVQVLGSSQMKSALQRLRAQYAVVVIDTAMPVTSLQTQRFIAFSDAALLVVTVPESCRPHAAAVADVLAAYQSKFKGMVINKVDLEIYRENRSRQKSSPGVTSMLANGAAG